MLTQQSALLSPCLMSHGKNDIITGHKAFDRQASHQGKIEKHLAMQLLSKQPGYHRPQAAAPPAQPWAQQGQMQPQHAGWDAKPAPQYQQQYQQNQGQQGPAWQGPSQVLCFSASERVQSMHVATSLWPQQDCCRVAPPLTQKCCKMPRECV